MRDETHEGFVLMSLRVVCLRFDVCASKQAGLNYINKPPTLVNLSGLYISIAVLRNPDYQRGGASYPQLWCISIPLASSTLRITAAVVTIVTSPR